jgi:ribosomal protein L11 methyltransferase
MDVRPEQIDLTELTLTLRSDVAEPVSNRLVEEGAGGVVVEDRDTSLYESGALIDENVTKLKAYFPTSHVADVQASLRQYLNSLRELYPDAPEPQISVNDLPNNDWAHAWKRFFKPTHIGPSLVVKPSWESYRAKDSETVIEIDPGMAFGTGLHATTRLCMLAIQDAVQKVGSETGAPLRTALDVGTGTGILAILAAKLGMSSVTAIDVDPAAIEATKENALRNGVDGHIIAYKATVERVQDEFDIVVANILAEVLIKMRDALTARVKPGGLLILSGILAEKGSDVRTAYHQGPFSFIESLQEEEWTALIFRRN